MNTVYDIWEKLNCLVRTYERVLTLAVLPLVLVLYSLIGIRQGADVTDTMYSLANYENFSLLDPMWAIATFIPNITGALFVHLPSASTLVGMNVWCTLFVVAPALIVYYLMRDIIPVPALFFGEWLALSLCWCPRVILYNYMTYTFFTMGAVLLLRGLILDEGRKRDIFLLFAGFSLGLNVLVRFPNLTEALLIAVPVYEGLLKKTRPMLIMRDCLLCFAGYVAGFILPFLAVVSLYGFGAYGEMIASLFGMTGTASDYSASGMLTLIFDAYAHTLARMVVLVPLIAFGCVLFLIRRSKFIPVKCGIFFAALLVLVRYYFATGVLTRNYWYYDCMFSVAMMIVLISAVFFILDISGITGADIPLKPTSLSAIVIILVTPLGSNNYTYPLINNLFLIAPAFLYALWRVSLRFLLSVSPDEDEGLSPVHIPWVMTSALLVILLFIQGGLFHSNFSFADGDDGAERSIRVSSVPRIEGQMTTSENALALGTLYKELINYDAPLLTFGKIPGLIYLTEMEPAIDTVWPDLDSYTAERFDSALSEMIERPVIVVRDDTDGEALAERKFNLLLFYMEQNGYREVFTNGSFTIYYF